MVLKCFNGTESQKVIKSIIKLIINQLILSRSFFNKITQMIWNSQKNQKKKNYFWT